MKVNYDRVTHDHPIGRERKIQCGPNSPRAFFSRGKFTN